MYIVFLIIGGILLLASPIVFLIALIKSLRKKKAKKWWISLIIVLVIFGVSESVGITLMPENTESQTADKNTNTTVQTNETGNDELSEAETSTEVNEESENVDFGDDIFSDVIKDDVLRGNFIESCKQVNIDIKKI